MLNDLILHKQCTITTTAGDSVSGVYAGVETPHGDWAVLVRQDAGTLSIPMEFVREAFTPAGA